MDNKETKQLLCKNCGAKIDELDAKCPFCGHINFVGAEHEFMENMYRTEENLDKITEDQVDDIKKEVKKNSKLMFIVAGIAGAVALVVVLYMLFINLILGSYDAEEDAKDRMFWQKENFPILNEWYEAGEYEKILDFQRDLYLSDDSGNYSLYEWEHYYFLQAYQNYVCLTEYEEKLNRGDKIDAFDAKYMLYYGMWLYYNHYDKEYGNFTEKDIELITTVYRDKAEELLFERMKFTKEELDEVHQKVVSEDGRYIEWDKCKKYGKKLYKRFE